MIAVKQGQCGLCTHFGEDTGEQGKGPQFVEILATHQASESLVAHCGHPQFEGVHLQVTPGSRCDGYDAAAA